MTCRGVHPRGGQSGDAAGEPPHGGSVDLQAPEDGILRVQESCALHPVPFAIKHCQDSDPAQIGVQSSHPASQKQMVERGRFYLRDALDTPCFGA